MANEEQKKEIVEGKSQPVGLLRRRTSSLSPNPWGSSGRQEMMKMRNLWQRRISLR